MLHKHLPLTRTTEQCQRSPTARTTTATGQRPPMGREGDTTSPGATVTGHLPPKRRSPVPGDSRTAGSGSSRRTHNERRSPPTRTASCPRRYRRSPSEGAASTAGPGLPTRTPPTPRPGLSSVPSPRSGERETAPVASRPHRYSPDASTEEQQQHLSPADPTPLAAASHANLSPQVCAYALFDRAAGPLAVVLILYRPRQTPPRQSRGGKDGEKEGRNQTPPFPPRTPPLKTPSPSPPLRCSSLNTDPLLFAPLRSPVPPAQNDARDRERKTATEARESSDGSPSKARKGHSMKPTGPSRIRRSLPPARSRRRGALDEGGAILKNSPSVNSREGLTPDLRGRLVGREKSLDERDILTSSR